jgi:hypothetical protein
LHSLPIYRRAATSKSRFNATQFDMYNIPGLAGEPSIEDIGMQMRGPWREWKDVVLMATGVKFFDRAKPPR